jgi:hypothetical protein
MFHDVRSIAELNQTIASIPEAELEAAVFQFKDTVEWCEEIVVPNVRTPHT